MSLKDLGKLAKLKIIANGEEFEVMFNPESYSEKFSIEYRKRESANSDVEEYDYVKSMPQNFKLNIIIDTTGVTEFDVPYLSVLKQQDSVYSQVNKFLYLTWYLKDGKPNPLEIKWGEFSFHCRLKEVDIKYTLFNREGLPIRAELDATFIGYSEKNQMNYKKRFQQKIAKDKASSSSPQTTETSPSNSSGGQQKGISIRVS